MNKYIQKMSTAGLTSAVLLASQVGTVLAQANIKITEPSKGAGTDLGAAISAMVNAVIVVSGLLTFVMLVWGGIQWLTSGGDKAAYEAARGRITAAIIGLAIVACAYAIANVVTQFFGFSLTDIQLGTIKK